MAAKIRESYDKSSRGRSHSQTSFTFYVHRKRYTNDIFDTLADTGTDYDTAIQRLTEHFSPTENKDMAIFDFRQVTQQSGESIDEFYRRLKEKSSLCGFHDEDNEIKTQIIRKKGRQSFTSQSTSRAAQLEGHYQIRENLRTIRCKCSQIRTN